MNSSIYQRLSPTLFTWEHFRKKLMHPRTLYVHQLTQSLTVINLKEFCLVCLGETLKKTTQMIDSYIN